MSNLVHTTSSTLTEVEFSRDQVEIIRNTICPGIKDNELSYCLEVAGRLGANPILKEVHFIFQNVQGGRKVMVQLGIDFYRRRAMETGRLLGKKIQVCDGDGNWYDVLPANAKLYAARCQLFVKGMDLPIERIAYWREFGEPNANNPIWRTKSIHMLTKVAESHAIRDMCAGQLGGTVTEDEVDAGDTVEVTQSKSPPAPRQSLPAPASAQAKPAQTEPAGKTPDQAKRDVLTAYIRDFVKRLDGNDAENTRKTVSRMSKPGPFSRKWPDFKEWSTDQLEELASVYEALESGEAEPEQPPTPAPADQDNADVIEAEVSEPEEHEALANEVFGPRKEAGVDADGKPAVPY